MNESELNVNPGLRDDSQSLMRYRASVRIVSTSRDDAVSSYIRSRLLELEASKPKGWQLELARQGRLAPSTVAQVKRGTGVGAKTVPGFAKAFGFKTSDDLRSAAYRWWETEGRLAAAAQHPAPAGAPTPVMGEAVDAVLALYPTASRERLEGILEAFSHARFANRDRAWWIQTLLNELRADEDAELDARRAGNRERSLPAKPRKRP